jgi:hypothetical protein
MGVFQTMEVSVIVNEAVQLRSNVRSENSIENHSGSKLPEIDALLSM